jgi:Mrp family chromosome partitioning ATPase
MNLSLVPVRATRPDSPVLLAAGALADLLASFRSRADDPICIIDMPPVLVVDDILLIAQHLDGVLMVVEEGKTRRSELREALRMLHPIPLVGTVLNKSVFGGVRRDFDPSYYYR